MLENLRNLRHDENEFKTYSQFDFSLDLFNILAKHQEEENPGRGIKCAQQKYIKSMIQTIVEKLEEGEFVWRDPEELVQLFDQYITRPYFEECKKNGIENEEIKYSDKNGLTLDSLKTIKDVFDKIPSSQLSDAKDKFKNAFWMEMCEKAKNWVLWHICKFFCALSCEHFLPCFTTIAKA